MTQRASAGTLGTRVKEATARVFSVGALPMAFQRMLGCLGVCSKYLYSSSHGCEGSALFIASSGTFLSAVARAVWSRKLPVTNTPALLGLLDAPWVLTRLSMFFGAAFARCGGILLARLMRKGGFSSFGLPLRDLLDTAPFIFSFPLHWRLVLPGILSGKGGSGPVQHFRSAIFFAWQDTVATEHRKRKRCREKFGFDMFGSRQLLVSPHLAESDNMLLRTTLSVECGMDLLNKARNEDFPCRFCGNPDGDVFFFINALSPPSLPSSPPIAHQPRVLPIL